MGLFKRVEAESVAKRRDRRDQLRATRELPPAKSEKKRETISGIRSLGSLGKDHGRKWN